MSKVSLFMMISLDGYFEGVNHDLSWHNVDQEFNDFAAKQLDEFDVLVFGHRTYEMMASFWSSDQAKAIDPVVAEKMNTMSKVVVADVPLTTKWANTQIISTDLASNLNKVKENSQKGLLVLGSSNLCISLIEQNLLEELRLMINPVVIGRGTSLFDGLKSPLKLKLTDSRQFSSSNVLNTYQVK